MPTNINNKIELNNLINSSFNKMIISILDEDDNKKYCILIEPHPNMYQMNIYKDSIIKLNDDVVSFIYYMSSINTYGMESYNFVGLISKSKNTFNNEDEELRFHSTFNYNKNTFFIYVKEKYYNSIVILPPVEINNEKITKSNINNKKNKWNW